MNNSLLTETDKFFWHDYISFYESFFLKLDPKSILEIGVEHGHSIRYLLERFRDANILGADIVTRRGSWPIDPRFSTLKIDQGDTLQVIDLFAKNKFDLIIEDGSHNPDHQVVCLIYGIKAVNLGGIYILEDIHTSQPLTPLGLRFAQMKRFLKARTKFPRGNALSILLGIGHYKRIGVPIDHSNAEVIAKNTLIDASQVLELSQKIKSVHLYRRNHLPDKCICGSTDYDYSNYKCFCGREVFSNRDSMSFVIECI